MLVDGPYRRYHVHECTQGFPPLSQFCAMFLAGNGVCQSERNTATGQQEISQDEARSVDGVLEVA
jgi:hypothetical protein